MKTTLPSDSHSTKLPRLLYHMHKIKSKMYSKYIVWMHGVSSTVVAYIHICILGGLKTMITIIVLLYLPPASLANLIASSTKFWYSGIWAAVHSKDGLVVASVGLYWSMAVTIINETDYVQAYVHSPLMSPVSATTVVSFFNCSKALSAILHSIYTVARAVWQVLQLS